MAHLMHVWANEVSLLTNFLILSLLKEYSIKIICIANHVNL